MAKRLIEKNPNCENLAELFLNETEKRINILEKSKDRIEKFFFLIIIYYYFLIVFRSLKNAMGSRYEKLKKEFDQTTRSLKTNLSVANKVKFFKLLK